jgi:hypothetical protein
MSVSWDVALMTETVSKSESTKLHSAATQKTVIFILAAVRTSNLSFKFIVIFRSCNCIIGGDHLAQERESPTQMKEDRSSVFEIRVLRRTF